MATDTKFFSRVERSVEKPESSRPELIFLQLPSAELALARVSARVAQGGHAVAPEVVRRRLDAGWRHFQAVYRRLVDSWIVYDNAGPQPVPIASGDNP